MAIFYAVFLIFISTPFLHARGRGPSPEKKYSHFKNSGLYYTGEGWADAWKDGADAREKAKTRALADLARNFRVDIRSALTDVLGEKNGKNSQSLESRINTYTEAVVSGLDGEVYILNFPRKNVLTCLAAVSRARYDEKVRRDMETKKSAVREAARAGISSEKKGGFEDALRGYLSALRRTREYFPGLGLSETWEDGGSPEDISSWASRRAERLLSEIRISLDAEKIFFGSDGRIFQTSVVRVFRNKTPLENFPLAGILISAGRKVSFMTEKGGRAKIPLEAADAFIARETLSICPDAAALGAPPEWEARPCVFLAMEKRKRLILFFDGKTLPASERDRWKETLARAAQSPAWSVEARISPDDGDISEGRVPEDGDFGGWFEARSSMEKHPRMSLYKAKWTVRGGIYDGRKNVWLFREDGPSEESIDADGTRASARARAALEPAAARWLSFRIRRYGPAPLPGAQGDAPDSSTTPR